MNIPDIQSRVLEQEAVDRIVGKLALHLLQQIPAPRRVDGVVERRDERLDSGLE
jgi:hypothetical protein